MSRPRHWVNRGEGGECVFVTTTVLDFVHAFRRDEVRNAMVSVIFKACRLAKAQLHAYVVMPHHIHLLIQLRENMTSSQFMQRFKTDASAAIKPLLTPEEKAAFSEQAGLNGNTFWQRSFRGLVIDGPDRFYQKARYIHLNPVKAEYVEEPADYRWSSARAWEEGLWSADEGLRG